MIGDPRIAVIYALVDAASPQDIQDARKAIELITLRGFHRDRDLAAEWTRLAAKW